jgi:chromosome segregation ATPase
MRFQEVGVFGGLDSLRSFGASILCGLILFGCATVDDPRKADIFTFNQEKSRRFIEAQEAELDALKQQRAQLELERERLEQSNMSKEKERDVLLAQSSQLNKDMNRLESQVASLRASSAKLDARRKDLRARIMTLKREVEECQKQVQQSEETEAIRKKLDTLRSRQRQLEQEFSILSGNAS